MKRHLPLAAILAVLALSGSAAGDDAPLEPPSIAITARRFEFEPSVIRLKKGEKVKLVVTSADVAHGFFQRSLKIDLDLAPGKPSEVIVTPQESGTYMLICDHFCGAQHGAMKMTIVVE